METNPFPAAAQIIGNLNFLTISINLQRQTTSGNYAAVCLLRKEGVDQHLGSSRLPPHMLAGTASSKGTFPIPDRIVIGVGYAFPPSIEASHGVIDHPQISLNTAVAPFFSAQSSGEVARIIGR